MTSRPTPCRQAAALLHDRNGGTALEFAVVCPVFLLLLLGIFCAGVTGLIQIALDDSVRDATRQVQMDTPASASAAGFLAAVCSEFSLVATNCTTSVTYDVQAAPQSRGFASLTPATLNAAGALPNGFFNAGTSFAANIDVLVQVAYPLPFSVPLVGSFATLTGTNSVLATASARIEPFPS